MLKSDTLSMAADEYLIGKSSAIREICEMIEKVAATDATVLITGETGVGKGLVARLIHSKSARHKENFVVFSCGSLPESLVESELFGHRKGTFTGAVEDRKGLFEIADGGTLFLDDIQNMPLSIQVKLLRALEEKKIRKLGEPFERGVNVRIICAKNQDLEKMVKQGLFREDLFYRISVLILHIPLYENEPLIFRSLLSIS